MSSPRLISELPFKALGGQPTFASDDLEAFVGQRRVAVLAYLRSNGHPNQVPIWHTYSNGAFHMSTVTDGPKHRALKRNPNVTLTIQDERPPYRAVIVDGVVDLTPLDADNDPTEGMAVRYFGRVGAAAYDKMTKEIYESSGLTLVTLQPRGVKGFDNTKALSRSELAFVRVREHLPIPRSVL